MLLNYKIYFLQLKGFIEKNTFSNLKDCYAYLKKNLPEVQPETKVVSKSIVRPISKQIERAKEHEPEELDQAPTKPKKESKKNKSLNANRSRDHQPRESSSAELSDDYNETELANLTKNRLLQMLIFL